ncbi:hypothetical protein [Gymnodinialimonas sp.]
MPFRYLPSLANLTVIAAMATGAQAQDLGQCPITSVVFQDQTGQQTFQPSDVAFDLFFLCDGEITEATEFGPRQGCRGPYGDYALIGSFYDAARSLDLHIVANFHVLPAAPCCGWEVQTISSLEPISEGLTRLPRAFVPRLEDWPDTTIGPVLDTPASNDGFGALFIELTPVSCRVE